MSYEGLVKSIAVKKNHNNLSGIWFDFVVPFTMKFISDDDEFLLEDWSIIQKRDEAVFHILPIFIDESIKLIVEKVIILRDEDIFGAKSRLKKSQSNKEIQKQIERLSFGDLNPGDYVVHIKHGVGKYEGLKVMSVNGIDSEFIQISYKETDKLYLPV